MTKEYGIVVLSLFDGKACGYEALKRAGIPVKRYYASEIDEKAMFIAKKNHPDIVHLGDVRKVKISKLKHKPDLVIGGSPCQGFSFAGKQLLFEDERSKLYFEYERIVKEATEENPDCKFLLENVKMKKEALAVITDRLGVDPLFINSALVSAQNRERYYWINWKASIPKDRGIMLKDILESGYVDRNESHILMTTYAKIEKRPKAGGCTVKRYHHQNIAQLVMEDEVKGAKIVGRRVDPKTGRRRDNDKSLPLKQRIEVRKDAKSFCLTTVNKDTVVVGSKKGLILDGVLEGKGHEHHRRVYNPEGKSPTIIANPGGGAYPPKVSVEEDFSDLIGGGYKTIPIAGQFQPQPQPRDYKKRGLPRVEGYEARRDGKSNALLACSPKKNLLPVVADNDDEFADLIGGASSPMYYRKLTPTECERLQTLPDGYTAGVSDNQRYRMIGNGWTVEVIAHLFKPLRRYWNFDLIS